MNSNENAARIVGANIIGLADGVSYVSVQLFGSVAAGFLSPVKVVVGGFVMVEKIRVEIFTDASWTAVGVLGLYDVAVPVLTVLQASTFPINFVLSHYLHFCIRRTSTQKAKLLQWPLLRILMMETPKIFPTR